MTPSPKSEQLDPALLVPNPWNTNVVSPEAEAKLDASIKRFGMFKPVVVRELPDGRRQILGGAHRAASAVRQALPSVPVINLGVISDAKAKEISLVDNSRYGQDDVLQLAELMESLGNAQELTQFMPYTDADIDSIFSSVTVALDDLDLDDDPGTSAPVLPKEKPIQTHQIMRFKVPVDDVKTISTLVEETMKTQKFTESDSLSNAGDALVYLLTKR